jgi:SMC interacting uncharacterized protein involved in chromosome segregation
MPRITNEQLREQIRDFRHDVQREFDDLKRDVLRTLDSTRRLLMAMGQATQDAINNLNVEVTEMAETIGGIVDREQALRDEIARLAASNLTLEEKNAELVRLGAELDEHLASQVRPVSERINALDESLKDPATPLAPTV